MFVIVNTCNRCNRKITDEVSLQFGLGPVCRKKLGIQTIPLGKRKGAKKRKTISDTSSHYAQLSLEI